MSASLSFGLEVVSTVSFASAVADQSFPRTHPITPLVLPEAMGGAPPTSLCFDPCATHRIDHGHYHTHHQRDADGGHS